MKDPPLLLVSHYVPWVLWILCVPSVFCRLEGPSQPQESAQSLALESSVPRLLPPPFLLLLQRVEFLANFRLVGIDVQTPFVHLDGTRDVAEILIRRSDLRR